MVTIKSKREIELMKEVCKVVANFYEQLEKKIRPGISTYELDKEAEQIMRKLGAIPAQIGYDPGVRGMPKFPSATCISINEEIIHGIPSKNRIIKDGDIVSIDTIGEYVKSQGFSVLKEFQGHGIGKQMHEDPGIPNYGKSGKGIRIEPGMTLCIEPMIIEGKPGVYCLDDGWTIVTKDGSRSAHYENTILITQNEPEILTIN